MASKKKSSLPSNKNQTTPFGFLGFNDLPIENESRLVSGIDSWIHSEFLLRVARSLDPKNIEEFIQLIEKDEKDEEALINYLQAVVPDLNELLEESVMVVRAQLSIQKNLLSPAL